MKGIQRVKDGLCDQFFFRFSDAQKVRGFNCVCRCAVDYSASDCTDKLILTLLGLNISEYMLDNLSLSPTVTLVV